RLALTGHALDLEGNPARQNDIVVENVARIGRYAKDGRVGAFPSEQALREFGRKVPIDGEGSLEQTMGLGMDRTNGASIILGGSLEDVVEGLFKVSASSACGCSRLGL
ncbi:MAG: hypothetical protein VW935_11430, partial [Novosphingobium sp.]